MTTKLERKYPKQFECARLLATRDLEHGLKYYARGGKHTAFSYRDNDGS